MYFKLEIIKLFWKLIVFLQFILSEKIKHHALLVLEENQVLDEQNQFQKEKLLEVQRNHINESKPKRYQLFKIIIGFF